MSKNTISLAQWGMQPELSALWMDCFSDTRRGVRYFFANAFRPENCLTLRAGERLAAALYLLPVRLLRDGSEIKLMVPWNATTVKDKSFFTFGGQTFPLPDELDTVVEITLK